MNVTSISTTPKRAIEPKTAVACFLRDMAKVARRTFPGWHKTLTTGIEECALSYDQRRAVLEVHPLDDYFFAGVVALEASKLRMLFAPDEAAELLSQLGEQVDAAAERTDRVVSDLVFFLIGRVELASGVDQQKMPYDQVVKALLQRLGIDKIEATAHLMTELLYRHTLGEPLALEVPHWWTRFKQKYALVMDGAPAPAVIVGTQMVSAPSTAEPTPRKPRRAVAF